MEINPGEFAVFGGIDLEGVTLEPAPLLPTATKDSFENAVAAALAAGNVGAQAIHALAGFEGLVRLSPATVEAIKAGATPMSNGVYNLGSLTDSSGKIVQTVQWTMVGAASLPGLPAVAAAVGPALALMGIQMQLARISRLVEEGNRLTDAVLLELRTEKWAEVQSYHQGMLAMVAEAREIGAVNDNIWQNVAGNELLLRSVREEFRLKVDNHLSRLDNSSGPIEVRETLDHHGDAIVADVQGFLQAQAAWFTYQAIRAGHLQFSADRDPTAQEHMQTIVANAREQHDQYLYDASRLIDALVRRSSAMVDAKAAGVLPFGKKRRAAKQVASAAKVLAKQLAVLRDTWDLADPPVPSPRIAAVQYSHDSEAVSRVVRWHLRPAEELLAIAVARDQSSSRDLWSWNLQRDWLVVAVTDDRVIVAKQKLLQNKGEIAGDIPLGDLRFVRYQPGSGKPDASDARMEVTTAERDLKLRFADWATDGDRRAQVDSFALLLQSQMRLPEAEVPQSPIPMGGSDQVEIKSIESKR